MLLQLIKYHPLFAYSKGDQFEVNDEDTKTLLEGKYAVPVGDHAQIETPEDKQPEPETASVGMTTKSLKKGK